MNLRHLAEAVFNPFFLIILLLIFLLFKSSGGKINSFLFYGYATILVLLLLFSTGWLPQFLINHLENQYPIIMKPDEQVKWVVVLSGGQYNVQQKPANMVLSGSSMERLIEGLRLYRQMPQATLLLSGGDYQGKISEAERMAELALWFGMPENKLILEKCSLTTAEQAQALKLLLKNQSFYLVTSAMHMHRAMGLLQTAGLKPIAAPTNYTNYWRDERWQKTYLPNAHNLMFLSRAMHEIYGIIWAKFTKEMD